MLVHVSMCVHTSPTEHPHPLTCMAWFRFSVDVLKQWRVRSSTLM